MNIAYLNNVRISNERELLAAMSDHCPTAAFDVFSKSLDMNMADSYRADSYRIMSRNDV